VVRLKDIAEDLHVSVVTVSKVLRGHSDISAATRERVLGRVRELNYRPNLTARSLVTGRTYMVGLVVPDLLHPFFAQIAVAVGNRLRPEGYNIVLLTSDEDPDLEIAGIESLLAHRVDGLIVASTLTKAQSDIFARIEMQKTPYVLVDRKVPGLPANFVGVDDREIGVVATEHLIERGNRRIAHIGGPDVSTAAGRLAGYMEAMARHGLAVPSEYVVRVSSADFEGEKCGSEAMQQLLALEPRPDAVFCYNDLLALGALRAAQSACLKVPNDIALIGVCNMPYSDMLEIPLSTIDQNSLVMGDRAAKLLLKVMKRSSRESTPKPRPSRIYVRAKLIVRKSSALPASALAAEPAPALPQATELSAAG
jgi:LacI family transcriptional regulator